MTSGRGYNEDMRLAHVLADQADSISLDRFKAQDLKVDTKPDLTPVTDADRAVEEQLRDHPGPRPHPGRGPRRGVRHDRPRRRAAG